MRDRLATHRVSLHVRGRGYPAVALELSGHRAAIRSARWLAPDDEVRVRIAWAGGSTTSLPARVRAVAPAPGAEVVAHVDVEGVEGDWRSFLAYVGPQAATA